MAQGVGQTPAGVADSSVSKADVDVRAAGGVVWRFHGDQTEVLVIHRPRYDDWSLPKGKAEAGERDEDTAVREVIEETGYVCQLGAELGDVRYLDRSGRYKVVRYWAMEPVEDLGFEPGAEVDERRWLPMAEAAGLLSYERDGDVLATFEALEER